MLKADTLLDAMGAIDDTYILSAERRAGVGPEGGLPQEKVGGRGRPRRLLSAALAAALALGTLTAALAVNEDFREAVFRVFRVSVPATVLPVEDEPEASGKIQVIDRAVLEGTVTAETIRLDGISTFSDGVIYMYDDESREHTRAYTVEEGALVPLERHDASFAYNWEGCQYAGDFYWYELDGELRTNARDSGQGDDMGWRVSPVEGRTDVVAVTLGRGTQIEHEVCPLLYDLETGETANLLGGCDFPPERQVRHVELAPGLSGLIATCGGVSEEFPFLEESFYCDLATGEVRSLDQWSGLTGADAYFVDSGTILCIGRGETGWTCIAIDLASGSCTETVSSIPSYGNGSEGGLELVGGRYALYIDGERATWVYDLKTGERAPVDGFRYPEEDPEEQHSGFLRNRDGTKLLFYRRDGAVGGLRVSEMGVLDLERKLFTIFPREGYEARHEWSLTWFDEDTLAVAADLEEQEFTRQYLYLYTVEPPADLS